ncbi:MAG: hypothetical protein SFX73_03915 [Kofleriaceae bacterium]|nr:hypothetical protein [Kofleriaceae bacterium]
MRAFPLLVLGLAACGTKGYHASSIDGRELSSENRKCGYNAASTDKRAPSGDLMRYWLPCWDDSKGGARYVVHTDPATAAKLAQVEAEQCVGLFPAALERSPFAQREAIEEIVPHRLGASVIGAHIVFKVIPGLTVSWMRRAIACHQARWEILGRPADYLAGDPTIVSGAEVEVLESNYRVVVRVAVPHSETDAQIVLDRAKALVAERLARKR